MRREGIWDLHLDAELGEGGADADVKGAIAGVELDHVVVGLGADWAKRYVDRLGHSRA